MEFYRVLNWNPSATDPTENGHPLFVWPDRGHGRMDDPAAEYLVLYVGSHPEAAVAEALGRFPVWGPGVLDLDDPRVLLDLGLPPARSSPAKMQ